MFFFFKNDCLEAVIMDAKLRKSQKKKRSQSNFERKKCNTYCNLKAFFTFMFKHFKHFSRLSYFLLVIYSIDTI